MNLERNYDMLKLIVQKMEIETEADNHDEGFHTSHSLDDAINPTCSKWNSDVLRKNLIRQNAVISKWKEHSQHSNIQSTFDCWFRFWWKSNDILADESLISTLLSILIKNKSLCVSCKSWVHSLVLNRVILYVVEQEMYLVLLMPVDCSLLSNFSLR